MDRTGGMMAGNPTPKSRGCRTNHQTVEKPEDVMGRKQESHFPGGSTQMETSQTHSCFSGVEKLPVS